MCVVNFVMGLISGFCCSNGLWWDLIMLFWFNKSNLDDIGFAPLDFQAVFEFWYHVKLNYMKLVGLAIVLKKFQHMKKKKKKEHCN